jgi:hypothetical protein
MCVPTMVVRGTFGLLFGDPFSPLGGKGSVSGIMSDNRSTTEVDASQGS